MTSDSINTVIIYENKILNKYNKAMNKHNHRIKNLAS